MRETPLIKLDDDIEALFSAEKREKSSLENWVFRAFMALPLQERLNITQNFFLETFFPQQPIKNSEDSEKKVKQLKVLYSRLWKGLYAIHFGELCYAWAKKRENMQNSVEQDSSSYWFDAFKKDSIQERVVLCKKEDPRNRQICNVYGLVSQVREANYFENHSIEQSTLHIMATLIHLGTSLEENPHLFYYLKRKTHFIFANDWCYTRAQNLFLAVECGQFESLQKNLKFLGIYFKNHYGQPLVQVAAANGHLPIVEFLIQKGCLLQAEDQKEWTALHHAVANDHVEVCHSLWEQLKETINLSELIEFAIENNRLQLFKFLYSQFDSITDAQLQRYLVHCLGEFTEKDNQMISFLLEDIALRTGNDDFLSAKMPVTSSSFLSIAAKNGHVKTAEAFLKRGVPVAGSRGPFDIFTAISQPVILALYSHHFTLAAELLKRGARIFQSSITQEGSSFNRPFYIEEIYFLLTNEHALEQMKATDTEYQASREHFFRSILDSAFFENDNPACLFKCLEIVIQNQFLVNYGKIADFAENNNNVDILKFLNKKDLLKDSSTFKSFDEGFIKRNLALLEKVIAKLPVSTIEEKELEELCEQAQQEIYGKGKLDFDVTSARHFLIIAYLALPIEACLARINQVLVRCKEMIEAKAHTFGYAKETKEYDEFVERVNQLFRQNLISSCEQNRDICLKSHAPAFQLSGYADSIFNSSAKDRSDLTPTLVL